MFLILLVRYLHEHRYARRIPRPMPEPPDRETWLEKRKTCATELAALLADPRARVFFGDEAGFEGDPRPRHRWVKRGSRPTQGYYGGHLRRNIVGAVEPASGQLVSLIVAHCNTEVFRLSVRFDCDLTGLGYVREEELASGSPAILGMVEGRIVDPPLRGKLALSDSDNPGVLSRRESLLGNGFVQSEGSNESQT